MRKPWGHKPSFKKQNYQKLVFWEATQNLQPFFCKFWSLFISGLFDNCLVHFIQFVRIAIWFKEVFAWTKQSSYFEKLKKTYLLKRHAKSLKKTFLFIGRIQILLPHSFSLLPYLGKTDLICCCHHNLDVANLHSNCI